MMRKMRALTAFRYGTRQLSVGDEFKATRAHAFVLTKMRPPRAEYLDGSRERVDIPPIPAALLNRAMAGKPQAVEYVDDLSALRAEYATKVGRRPFMGWDAAELRKRMAGVA